MGTIAVLGSANIDLVVRQPRRAEPGETVFGTGFSTGPGGKGINQAVAAARAGADVVFIGAVGHDEFGERLRETLDSAGADSRLLRRVDSPTGVAVINVTDDGENTIVVVPGANTVDDLTDDERAAIAASSALVVQLERPIALVRAAMTWARAHGVTTVLTPAPAVPGIEDVIDLADIIIPNEGEASLLTGEGDADAAALSLTARAGTAIVTLGSRGAVVARERRIVHRVGARAVSTVDTTGAGDTFVGVLVAWLSRGAALEDALDAATAGASITVTRPGAAASVPERAEILHLLRSTGFPLSRH